MVEHEISPYCWCRPKLENTGVQMLIVHRDVDPPHYLASRQFMGGEEYDGDGGGAQWMTILP